MLHAQPTMAKPAIAQAARAQPPDRRWSKRGAATSGGKAGVGVACALENPTLTSSQHVDVTRPVERQGGAEGVRERDRGDRPFGRRDARRRTLHGVDADRERRALPVGVVRDHQRDLELVGPFLGDRDAQQASGLPHDAGLVRTRATRPQVGLDRVARRENVRDAFAWDAVARPHPQLLLIDDVLTSGATANECAAILKAAGARWVGLLAIARAADHRSDR